MSRKPSRRRPSASRPKSVPQNPPIFTAAQRELVTKRRGELAELAFTLKAATLGFGVSKPFGDSERYDVITDSRTLVPSSQPPASSGAPCVSRSLREKWGCSSCQTLRSLQTHRKKNHGCPVLRDLRKHIPASPACPLDPNPPLWRVQVKCTTQVTDGMYRLNAHRRIGGRAVPYKRGEIHFLAAYVIPENTWYILPLDAFLGSTSLLFRSRHDRKRGMYDQYREAWHLLRPK
jgi:hypothetical protein